MRVKAGPTRPRPAGVSVTEMLFQGNAAAAAAGVRLLRKHGGCIEDAVAEARRLQLRYSPGTDSWSHYDVVVKLINGGGDAKEGPTEG